MKKSRFTDQQIAFALAAGGGRHAGRRGVSEDGRQPSDVFPVEKVYGGLMLCKRGLAAPFRFCE